MVRLQLQIMDLQHDVSNAWIDGLFDRFDADNSNLIDDGEWENLVAVLPSRMGSSLETRRKLSPRSFMRPETPCGGGE